MDYGIFRLGPTLNHFTDVHPKTLIEIAMFFRRTAALFRQIRTFP